MSYGDLCHCGNFYSDTSYELVYKYYHGWLKSMLVIETIFGVFFNLACLWWCIIMNESILNEKSLDKWQKLQHGKCIMPKCIYKEWKECYIYI